MSPPIEIIGGGLAGLSLGVALQRDGAAVRLYEAGDYPRHRVCGEFIAGLDATTIHQLGLQPVLAGALHHREVAWFWGEKPVQVHRLPEPALGMSRFQLDARLAAAFVAAGGELHPRTRVADLTLRPGRVFATGRSRQPSEWLGLKVHVRGLSLSRDLELHLGNEAYVGLSQVEEGWINVCGLFRQRAVEMPAAQQRRARASRQLSLDRGQIARTAGSRHDVSAPSPTRIPVIVSAYLEAAGLSDLAARMATAEFDPTSFCSVAALQFDSHVTASDRIQLGDACAMIPPFTGNGMAMAFQSAAVALEPLRQYARGKFSWAETCRVIHDALRRRFRVRLASADCLHPFLLHRSRQRGLAALSRTGILPLRPLYRLLH